MLAGREGRKLFAKSTFSLHGGCKEGSLSRARRPEEGLKAHLRAAWTKPESLRTQPTQVWAMGCLLLGG